MRPGNCRVLPETSDGSLLDLIEKAVWLPEDEAEGDGEKSLQGACDRRTDQSLPSSSIITGPDIDNELVCLFGPTKAQWRSKRGRNLVKIAMSDHLYA
jgi:hypothetical protein